MSAVIAIEVECEEGTDIASVLADLGLSVATEGDGYRINAISETRGRIVEEFAVERKWGLEIGASTGMSHHYPYTRESVRGLADGHPVYIRARVHIDDAVTDWELLPDLERTP